MLGATHQTAEVWTPFKQAHIEEPVTTEYMLRHDISKMQIMLGESALLALFDALQVNEPREELNT